MKTFARIMLVAVMMLGYVGAVRAIDDGQVGVLEFPSDLNNQVTFLEIFDFRANGIASNSLNGPWIQSIERIGPDLVGEPDEQDPRISQVVL